MRTSKAMIAVLAMVIVNGAAQGQTPFARLQETVDAGKSNRHEVTFRGGQTATIIDSYPGSFGLKLLIPNANPNDSILLLE